MFPTLTTDQLDFKRAVSDFSEAVSPSDEVRRLMGTETGFDPDVWTRMANELGLQAMSVPERYGGAGFGPVESAIVFEELGRTLLCSPLFSTVALGVNLLLELADDEACAEFLPGIAEGTTKATVAIYEESGRLDADSMLTYARGAGATDVLNGTKTFVIDGASADLILVVARADSGISVYAVDANGAGVRRTPLQTLDQTRKQALITFANADARLVGEAGQAWPAVKRTLDLAVTALAAEQVGGTEAVLAMTVEYVKARVQFGRPIGAFQAVKHKCADILMRLESARSAAGYAAWAAEYSIGDLPAAAALAKAYCSDAFCDATKTAIQLHGGIGFTWEHDAHLYLRRAKSGQLLFGTPAQHRDVLADLIGLTERPAA